MHGLPQSSWSRGAGLENGATAADGTDNPGRRTALPGVSHGRGDVWPAGRRSAAAIALAQYAGGAISQLHRAPRAHSRIQRRPVAVALGGDVDTASAVAYFAAFRPIEGDRSLYASNIHSGNAGLRLGSGGRAELYFGYHRVQDLGDGRAAGASGSAGFRTAQTSPCCSIRPWADCRCVCTEHSCGISAISTIATTRILRRYRIIGRTQAIPAWYGHSKAWTSAIVRLTSPRRSRWA